MKLNNKGVTLVELLISIALVVIVMSFIYKLLLDITNKQTNNSYAANNQINRNEIINTIEKDLISSYLLAQVRATSDNKTLTIKFIFDGDNKTSMIEATDKTLTYTALDGTKTKWTMNQCTIKIDKANIKISNVGNNNTTMALNIEIHTNNDENTEGSNNLIDDISISYLKSSTIKCTGDSCIVKDINN